MALRNKMNFATEPVYLMDGTAFIFRGFYAYQNMARSDGQPTNALYIVARILLKLLREERPSRFLFLMDGKGPNFRHELFPAYKAQRGPTPEGLVAQLEPVRRMVRALGLPLLVSEACEADDCIASMAARLKSEGPVVIIGADKDLKQCLDENVLIWDPGSKDEKITTLADFRGAENMEPASWPDYQAIIGDSSDNIPGVPGVGPKTASELFKLFSSLEEIRDRFVAVPPKIAKKLEGHMDEAFLYRELTRLRLDTCMDLGPDFLNVKAIDTDAALSLIEEFELRSLVRELSFVEQMPVRRAAPVGNNRSPLPLGKEAGKTAEKDIPDHAASSLPSQNEAPVAALSQASLLDVSAPAASLKIAQSEDIATLPKTGGSILALLPRPGTEGIILATNEKSLLFTGDEQALAKVLATPEQRPALLVCPDLKALYSRDPLWRGLPVENCFDLSLAAYLLNPEERDYSWEYLIRRWSEQLDAALSPTEDPGSFALRLYDLFASRLAAAEQAGLMRSLEMPLIPVLKDMEERGIRIDGEAFSAFLLEVQAELDRLEKHIHELAGGPFNIRSSQQLGDVLFTRLNLPRAGKTKGGKASTAQDALEKLAGKHPIIDEILQYRTLEKLRSTYLEPLPRLADETGRIHTNFNLMATATGRLSSSNPNLQNIPVRGSFGPRMRACFVAPPEKLLISADYSQVELRILAHLAKDPILTEAFMHGEDIHRRTASLLFDLAPEDVGSDQRRHAKTINFGLIYGMGPQKLGQDLGISMKEAAAFIKKYFERLGALREFYDKVEQSAKEHGYVTTLSGRRRYIPDISSANNQLRSQARRQAINAVVQGSAADVIKMAMLAVSRDKELTRLEARLLLQIHDELVLEVPEKNAQAAGELVAALMREAVPPQEEMAVPLVVDWGTGKNWNEAH